ncbi:serine protease inhibitor Kazal-type 7 isoform X1 [Moschus berezovskii]|uniref:serine protease inhibitor Kazal-type 7 isoform X1 n=1 Tax=Moschus berezovskii TaxID=68408 RepID=UPI0024448ACA|nr:serine protease inhibitor Kazal-type 7 isoform X1 [Moschus berezovskii]
MTLSQGMADAVVVTILSNLCITAVSIMKTTGGLLLLCAVAHLCSCSGRVMEKFSFFMKEYVNFPTDVDTEQGYRHCHRHHPWFQESGTGREGAETDPESSLLGGESCVSFRLLSH